MATTTSAPQPAAAPAFGAPSGPPAHPVDGPPVAGPPVERGRRRLSPRGPLFLFLVMAAIGFVAAVAGKLQGELLIGVAFVIVVVADLIGVYRAFGDPSVDLTITGDGEVNADLGVVIAVRGNRQPLWVRVGWWYPRWFTVSADAPGWARLRPNARGSVRWLDVDLVARGPLGLWRVGRRDRLRLGHPVAVGPPAIGHQVEFPALPTRPFGEATLTRGADDLTRGVRDYRPGDPRKLVHWPASAHHGRLLVRETETLGTTRLRVVVVTPTAGGATEVALGRASWLVRECLARGWEVELLTTERAQPPHEPPRARSPFSTGPTCSLVHESILASGPGWALPWPGAPGPSWSYGPPDGHGPARGAARGPALPMPPAMAGAADTTTRRADVRTTSELAARLAAVAPGPLDLPADRVRMRIISAGGDEWR